MGQAKRRGTFEQRYALVVEKQKEQNLALTVPLRIQSKPHMFRPRTTIIAPLLLMASLSGIDTRTK